MLDKLEKLLVDNGYHFESELKDVDTTPCKTSTVKVINFDKIKDTACKKFGIPHLPTKSSDLLILLKKKNELHIVEMKRTATQKADEFQKTYRDSAEFREKNIHSIFLILALASHFNIDENFYAYFFSAQPRQLRIRTSVLCDLPNSEMPYVFLSKINVTGVSFCQIIAGEVEVINCDTFEKYFATA